jgi:hypothetical protein
MGTTGLWIRNTLTTNRSALCLPWERPFGLMRRIVGYLRIRGMVILCLSLSIVKLLLSDCAPKALGGHLFCNLPVANTSTICTIGSNQASIHGLSVW